MVQYFTHGVTLAYRTFGSGPVAVLAFHGFGRTGNDFRVLEQEMGVACTIHAFDLHFHGKSPGYPERAERPFTPAEISAYFAAFLDAKGSSQATLLGYSLGGRIAMSLLEHMPERIERAFLVAADGLKPKPWYRALASSDLGRKGYRRFVEHPRTIHLLMDSLRAARLMSEKMHRFLRGQTDSQAKRMLVRDVWLSYRLIEPDLQQVASRAGEHGIPIHLIFGAFDRVIRPALGRNLSQYAATGIDQEDLPLGHTLLNTALGATLAKRLAVPAHT